MSDRIIGETREIAGTSFHYLFVGANHVGSDRDDRAAGDPSASPYDASMGVPFSLVHQDAIVGDGAFGALVDVTPENLLLIVAGLRHQQASLLAVLDAELVGVRDDLVQYLGKIPAREAALRQVYLELFAELYRPIRRSIGEVAEAFDHVVRSPVVSLPPVPGPARPVCGVAFTVFTELVDDVAKLLQDAMDDQVVASAEVVWRVHESAFFLGSHTITQASVRQCDSLIDGFDLIGEKWVALHGS